MLNFESKKEARLRAEKLRREIDYHRHLYHVEDRQEISAEALDSLKNELQKIEDEFPDLITPDSPTQRVGGEVQGGFKKFKHPQRMLSFVDVFNQADLEAWINRNKKIRPEFDRGGYFCDLKIDGLAMELVYRGGLLVAGATRGDGQIGEEVTENIKTITAIPLRLKGDLGGRGEVVVRGEVFMTKAELARVNRERTKQGESLYANPRNLAAGSIRQLDPKITATRQLQFLAYALISDLGQKTREQEYQILTGLGFPTNKEAQTISKAESVQGFRDKWEIKKDSLGFQIDGIVVSVNSLKDFQALGVVGKTPRGAVAYKFSPDQATTKVRGISVSVGRTGTLTPIALLEPVAIGGVTVSRATLHNEDEIERLGLRIGDTVVVGRAGDVIPDIIKVLPELRTGREEKFKFPKTCPICDGDVVRKIGEAAHRCRNKNCPMIKREGLYHAVSKAGLNIDGLGPKIIDQLVYADLIKDSADLFSLKESDLLELDRFAEISAKNIITAIKAKKTISLDRFLYSLGIPQVGDQTAIALAEHFGVLDKVKTASIEDLVKINDIGEIVAKSIADWFGDLKNQALLEKFKTKGVRVEVQKVNRGKLFGKTFLFTGTLNSISRLEASNQVRALGGKVVAGITKDLDYLVAGKTPGSKLEKARSMGITILDENQFSAILK
ncbi:MAG: hypothetical protein COV31_02525 [Candidatus Yanofskybacteria bacterium CG10_big_fil_rev_8_21_14_0_10_46_23]|uniref:DNA ligase n=1 Tax=Candidatus Yanofskybacteria bacterium CG10_big_fil_rev_8_21_14_0_10_46_23 TaxID=1975098 RepID=A0A2H0R4L6_9BACT|nr:MAG: hypothetical protein COV31_02525 [Candidatus Yanofskybacteria bacterium CG10_big_fil_rev_8_21_14_0_10_46_23]